MGGPKTCAALLCVAEVTHTVEMSSFFVTTGEVVLEAATPATEKRNQCGNSPLMKRKRIVGLLLVCML